MLFFAGKNWNSKSLKNLPLTTLIRTKVFFLLLSFYASNGTWAFFLEL
jgi:hypothetical protein